MQKDYYPGYLDLSAGGVVNGMEDEDTSAMRELNEELGIPEEEIDIKFLFK
jgi:8-oxo-dGTP pyrophosphatase MutT (NUDIX family)